MRTLSVIARNSSDGLFYPGSIHANSPESPSIMVQFYSLKPQKVQRGNVIVVGGASPWPHLMVRDYVLVQIQYTANKTVLYVPGVVKALPLSRDHDTKNYLVLTYTHVVVERPRRFIVKIGPEKHAAILAYIKGIGRNPILRPGPGTDGRLVKKRRPFPSREAIRLNVNIGKEPYTRKTKAGRILTATMLFTGGAPFINPKNRKPITGKSSSTGNIRQPKAPSGKMQILLDVINLADDTTKNDVTKENTPNTDMKLEDTGKGSKHNTASQTYLDDTFKDSGNDDKTKSKNSKDNSQTRAPSPPLQIRNPSAQCPQGDQNGDDQKRPLTSPSPSNRSHDVICNGEEVLVRWSDDGWYYYGIIMTEVSDDQYVVKDATGYAETIDKRHILSDIQREYQVLQPGDTVIGLHPNYLFSYAPARVTDVYPNTGAAVEFYDRTRTRLPFVEAYRIPEAKYREDVHYIRECEKKMCVTNHTVIARDDRTGVYVRCRVECPANERQNYFIQLPDNTFARQSVVHIFTPQSRAPRQEDACAYLLAPINAYSSVYLPACITQYRPLAVQFCDGNVSKDVQSSQCFYISSNYYRNAADFYIHAQARSNPKIMGEGVDRQQSPSLWQQTSVTNDVDPDRLIPKRPLDAKTGVDVDHQQSSPPWQHTSATNDVDLDRSIRKRPLDAKTVVDKVGSNSSIDDRSDTWKMKSFKSFDVEHNSNDSLEFQRTFKSTISIEEITHRAA